MSYLLPSALIAISLVSTALAILPVFRHRTTEGIALSSTLTCMFATATWTVYGIAQGNSAQVVVNLVATGGGLAILAVGLRSGRLDVGQSIRGTAAYGTIAVITALTFGVTGIGALVATLSIANKVPQVIETWKRPGGVAVSVPANLVTVSVCSGWLLYGLLHADLWLSISSAWGAGQALFVAIQTTTARRRNAEPSILPTLKPLGVGTSA